MISFRVVKPSVILGLSLALGLVACSDDGDDNPSTSGTGTGGADAGKDGNADGSAGTSGAAGSAGKDGSAGSGGAGGAGAGGAGGAGAAGAGAGGAGGAGAAGAGGGGAGGAGGAIDAGAKDADAAAPGWCTPLGTFAPPTVDESIKPPAGATLTQRFYGVGSQVYTCNAPADGAADGGAYAWSSAVPDAILYNESCVAVGTHFLGPTWKSNADNSTVVGSRVNSINSANAIPWLLLKASANTGSGIFSSVTAIQRVQTVGGLSPTTACGPSNVGATSASPYSAVYYFYTGGTWPSPDGGDASVPDSSAPDSATDGSKPDSAADATAVDANAADAIAADAADGAAVDAASADAGAADGAVPEAGPTDAGEGG